jgi:acetyl esterase
MILGKIFILLLFLTGSYNALAQSGAQPVPEFYSDRQVDSILLTYKQVDTTQLKIKVYKPFAYRKNKRYAAIIFFFGGGWNRGRMSQFEPQAKYFASRGMVAVVADYRVFSRHKTTPFEAVTDAKSAIRYLRVNARKLNIHPNKIVASGGSAGGHLAVAADLTNLEEPSENSAISSRPDALVLFNPVINTGPGGYGFDRVKHRYAEISPYHNIVPGAAPTIIFLGTNDAVTSVGTAQDYRNKMKQNGNRCELFLYEEQIHGFYMNPKSLKETLREADIFLQSLGYIKGKPTI